MKRKVLSAIKYFDRVISQYYLKHFTEKNSLMIFLFHGLFRNKKEVNSGAIYPLQAVTVSHIKSLVEYYLSHGYTFVSPLDILKGLKSEGRYVLLTFDDGYANNMHVLPVLKEYKTPAVFFVSTEHVKQNKCFWWDVFYRENLKRGVSDKTIIKKIMKFESMKNEDIENELIKMFSKESFVPTSDIDRPLTPSELKNFSSEPFVHIGNHTSDHAILINYSPEEIRSQILLAQNTIEDITGKAPQIISYPNGNYSDVVINICQDIGLKLGVTIAPKKNYLPVQPDTELSMRLGRFVLKGYNELEPQFKLFRSDFVLYNTIWNLVKG